MSARTGIQPAVEMVDHIVYAVPDLVTSVHWFEGTIGVRPTMGGKHIGRGTHNALLSLGPTCYLEIIAMDPDQQRPVLSRTVSLADVDQPRLIGWAIRSDDLDGLVERARAADYDPGCIQEMHRVRPDGTRLKWRYTDAPEWRGILVPFAIDWQESPHPATTSPEGSTLIELRGEHPAPGRIVSALQALGCPLPVANGHKELMVAILETPNGRVELR